MIYIILIIKILFMKLDLWPIQLVGVPGDPRISWQAKNKNLNFELYIEMLVSKLWNFIRLEYFYDYWWQLEQKWKGPNPAERIWHNPAYKSLVTFTLLEINCFCLEV
jgi:hypothetical protein